MYKFLSVTCLAFTTTAVSLARAAEHEHDGAFVEETVEHESYEYAEFDGPLEDDVDPLESAFFDGCMEGNIDVVEKSLKERPELLNQLDQFGQSCLHLAGVPYSDWGDGENEETDIHPEPIKMVKFLVEAGADVNLRSSEDYARMPALAFHVNSFYPETVEYLISKGAEVNAEFDGYGPEGERSGVWTVMDLLEDFFREADDVVIGMYGASFGAAMKKTKEVLLKSGAKQFVGSDEL